MESLSIWNFEGAEVRTAMKGNEPWWVLADICKVLGLTNPAKVSQRLKVDEKDITFSYTPGGQQEMTIINEKGLYRLIFRSNKPEAEAFQDWVFGEVLPSIRKYGTFSLSKPIPANHLPACDRPALPLEGWYPSENRKYYQKTFRGQKVWTLADASGETGIPYNDIVSARTKYFDERDSKLLIGSECVAFKWENPGKRIKAMSKIVIISEAGMAKLCDLFHAKALGNGV